VEGEKRNNKDTQWIDDFFDDLDDPKVDSCTLIGYIEMLILNTIFSYQEQDKLIKKLDNLRESEVSEFIYKLKLNQNIRDPKDQYQEMVRRGVFKN
tara:strand:- start:2700 stop:2987 length:288 start_codon:yes stop_codon:yes gene_type:complete